MYGLWLGFHKNFFFGNGREVIIVNRVLFFVVFLLIIGGCASKPKGAYQMGMASWYGARFHGKKTASGQTYNMNQMTAAHPSLKFGTKVKVVLESTKVSVVVRINDRGPFAKSRIIDLSKAAARKLGIIKQGHGRVSLYIE